MTRSNKTPLPERVHRAASAALAGQGFVSTVDMLMGIGWLDPNLERDWRRGRIACLEETIGTSPSRLGEAIHLLADWARARGLIAREVDYVSRTPQRQPLRFAPDGDAAREVAWRTHWMSEALPEKARDRIVEKASKPPELVVVQALNDKWRCHRCGKGGSLLMMEQPGPACLSCVGLGDLDFLPAGNALLTRRVKARSERHAVVVRFSRSRNRYERQGILVEPKALDEASNELGVEPRPRD